MSLVLLDPSPGAGIHALIVGVSRYPHLKGGDGPIAAETYSLGQLSCAATTALDVFEWLTTHQAQLPLPMKSCRLLLAASPGELGAHALPSGSGEATLDGVLGAAQEWRDDASRDRANCAFLYFAGHGVQRTREDAIALLSDFADGSGGSILRKAISTKSVVDGMAPSASRPDMARTQLFFVDACRIQPEEFAKFSKLEATPVFDVEDWATDDRRAPIYFAASPGTAAYGLPGGRTIFGDAVLDCLDGGAAVQPDEEDEPWRVSISSLARALELKLRESSTATGRKQEFIPGGTWRDLDTVVAYVDGTPDVDVILEVVPETANATVAVEAMNLTQQHAALPAPLQPHPYRCTWPAGYYAFTATDSGRARRSLPLPVMPPLFRKKVQAP